MQANGDTHKIDDREYQTIEVSGSSLAWTGEEGGQSGTNDSAGHDGMGVGGRDVPFMAMNGILGTVHERRMSEVSRVSSDSVEEVERSNPLASVPKAPLPAEAAAPVTETRSQSPTSARNQVEEKLDEDEVNAGEETSEPPRKPHNWKPHPWSLSWRQQHVSSMQALRAEQAATPKSSSSSTDDEEEEEAADKEDKEDKEDKDDGSGSDDEDSTRIFRNENLDHFRSQKGDAWKALLPPPNTSFKQPKEKETRIKTGQKDDDNADEEEEEIHVERTGSVSPVGSMLRLTAGFSSSIIRRLRGAEGDGEGGGRPMSPTASMEDMSGLLSRTMSAAFGSGGGGGGGEERTPKVSPFLQKYNFAGPQEIDNLLRGLGVECDAAEKDILLKAFICPVCDFANEACTTIADQIRAVFDAFRLIDADNDGQITLSELRDIASWTLEGEGNEFINNLIRMLHASNGLDPDEPEAEDEILISAKDFLMAFARCLEPDSELGTIEEILEKRAVEYRKIGSLFGMEKVQQQFHWNKFLLTFFSDTLAVVAFPLCKLLEHWRSTKKDDDDEEEDGPQRATLHDILTQSQWLPAPHDSFDTFQYYLMKLWMPSIFSIVCYALFAAHMQHISVAEVLSPTVIYIIIGSYISTISGYEHPRMVLRRMNMSLSAHHKLNELQAIFAFRAHTPEGHMVDQIGSIADFLFARRFRGLSNSGSAVAGAVHGLMPTVHRIWVSAHSREDETCSPEDVGGLWGGVSRVYFWLCGGHEWVHLLVSVPSAFISGYLTYRLLFITCVGFYNDLAFFNRLKLFRAMTQPEPFLRYRARWIRGIKRGAYQGRREFLQFLNLQNRDDLVLWCRIRQLMVESYAGFRTKQGDVMVTFMLLSVLALTSYIFFFQIGRNHAGGLSVFDMRARVDVFVFSLLLITIVNLKLSIHSLRKSDISLLHKEYYTASMSANSGGSAGAAAELKPKPVPQAGSRFAASFVRRKSFCSTEGSGWVSPMAMHREVRGPPGVRLDSSGVLNDDTPPDTNTNTNTNTGSRSHMHSRSRRTSFMEGAAGGTGEGRAEVAASQQGVQKLLEHTARYIAEFDRPPRLLSFTVSIHFLRYIFLPLLSPIIAALRVYTMGPAHRHHNHTHADLNATLHNASAAVPPPPA